MATQNAIGRLDKTQNVAYTATPATTAAVGSQTNKIRLQATTACAISIGAAVSVSLAANLPEYFIVSPGQVVSVVQISAAGSLCLTEIS
jgi:pimeloyl-ACP methyl ester carboxylesterase